MEPTPERIRALVRRVKARGKPSKETKASVTRLVKKVSLSTEETKQTLSIVSPAAPLVSAQAPNIGLLFTINRGTAAIADVSGNNVRIGTKVTLMSVSIKGSYVNGDITGPAMFRIIIFRDKQINGTIGTAAQLLSDTTAATCYQAPPNINNAKRFTIVSDRLVACNDSGGATDQSTLYPYTMVKKYKKGTILQYNGGTAGTVADCVSGQFFYCLITDAAAGAPFIAWTVDVKFKDA